VAVKSYYEEVLDPRKRYTTILQKCMEKVMEQVRKDHYLTFCKHLLIFDLTLGPNFLKEIQVHYDMNSKPQMFREALDVGILICDSTTKTLLKQWNECLGR
jgi:hypothetical protein